MGEKLWGHLGYFVLKYQPPFWDCVFLVHLICIKSQIILREWDFNFGSKEFSPRLSIVRDTNIMAGPIRKYNSILVTMMTSVFLSEISIFNILKFVCNFLGVVTA